MGKTGLRVVLVLLCGLVPALWPAPAAHGALTRSVSAGGVIRAAAVEWGCTVSATGYLERAGRRLPAVLSAGHCFGSSDRGTGYRPGGPVWGDWADVRPIGRLVWSSQLTAAQERRMRPADDPDVAVVALAPDVRAAPATTRRVGFASRGERVCKTGRVTGRTCGEVVSSNEDYAVVRIDALWGDSGAPLRDSSGRLLGILSRADVSRLGGTLGVPFVPGRNYAVFETIERTAVQAFRATGFRLDPHPTDE